ncbi:enhanced intracellular survival protein Eis [Paraliobacillus sp. JSM ZJ581]|uniref:GNAT family N-acetyltransferase n=1 Tax=Paraliobacillus sp. JSM ZJ581 TaxID=3342118 RepID=UPI0035A8A959
MTAKDFDQAVCLEEYAFKYRLSEVEKLERKEVMQKREINLGSFVDNQLAAKLHILPLQLFLGDEKLEFGGVAGVATWPEFRRTGHIHQLLMRSFAEMKEQGFTLSMLHPFLIKFYRKFGYEVTNYTYKYDLTPKDIPTYQTAGFCKRVAFEQEKATLKKLYKDEASQYGLMMNRDDWWWEKRVISEQDTIIIYYNRAGDALGYLIADINASHLRIKEFVYQSIDACQGLLQWLKNHDSMVNSITLVAQPNHSFAFYLDNPRIPLIKKAYFMSRIIDFSGFMKKYPYITAKEKVRLLFKLEDEHASWNNGKWLITFEDRKCKQVEKVDQATNVDINFEANINSITALLLGSESLENLQIFGKIIVKEEKIRWDDISQINKPHLFDFF